MGDIINNTLRDTANLSAARTSKLQRSNGRNVQEKKGIRESERQAKHSVPLAEIACHPLFQAITEAICPEDLKQEFAKLGVRNAAEAVIYSSQQHDNHILKVTSAPADPDHKKALSISSALIARAQREAKRVYRIMQHMLALKDPMNQGLRHTPSRLPENLEAAYQQAAGQAFASPSTLQSNQSTAAYLRHLYRIAMGIDKQLGIVAPQSGVYKLKNRRPDLSELSLSETNLKQQVPAIDIVNQVLESSLVDINVWKTYYPLALPFDEAAVTARTALLQIGGSSLNTVYTQTADTAFPLRENFRLAGDVAGLLGLNGATDIPSADGSVISLLRETASDHTAATPSTTTDLYHAENTGELSLLASLQSRLDLTFTDITQLLGLYVVHQENGRPVKQKDYATAFLQNSTDFTVVDIDESETRIRLDGEPIGAPDLRSLHYLARLHHSTGIDIHHLNLLLSVPGATGESEQSDSDNEKLARRHITATGLRVLGGFVIYRDAFGLSPEAYTALFDHVCPYWRADQIVEGEDTAVAGLEQTETSFMRNLFSDDAPWLHQTLTDAATPISNPKLSAIISRGLGITDLELNALVTVLTEFSLTQAVDARGLGALYRLTKVYQLFDRSIETGIALVSLVSSQSTATHSLLTSLTAKNNTAQQTDDLCTALDTLVALARWMEEAGLSPNTVLTILTPTDSNSLRASHDDCTWFDGLRSVVEPTMVNASTFSEFETWHTHDNQTTVITAHVWYGYLVNSDGLHDNGLYSVQGIFNENADSEAINAVCATHITEYPDIDQTDERNGAQFRRLVARLERTRDDQVKALQRQLATMTPNLSMASVASLIQWRQGHPLELLRSLLAGAEDTKALSQLYEMRRYASVNEALDVGDIGLWLMGYMPHWVSPSTTTTTIATAMSQANLGQPMAKPLNLEQLFYLQRFNQLQVGIATDAAWRDYLTLANTMPTESGELLTQWTTACLQALAILLGCSLEDIQAYNENVLGAKNIADTVSNIDALARHVRLASDLNIGAHELLALKAACHSDKSGDWTAAKTAALSALSRFDDGNQAVAFQHAFAEQKRDALVAAYMRTTIAANPVLAEQVTDRETLYSHLLIDVKVTSAVPTSRFVEAMNSLQLYITRALDGSEPDVGFVDRDALVAQWEIDKSYRLWEANRKLALYPQNYIEPELRYHTSPEFDELLQSVSGNNLDENSIESAVNTYMAGLANVCALSVCSLYVERLPDGASPNNANYHMLARADWEQGKFFYRKLEADFKTITELEDPSDYLKALDWSFWQAVGIPTTHTLFSDVTLCVFHNRYFFFWLELEERRNQTASGESVVWRLHPRYMRCNASAFSGPMHTPGLFFDNANGKAADTDATTQVINGTPLVIDNAFEWAGAKPTISATYHPITAQDACVYGLVGATADPSALLKNVIYVTFGINLTTADSDTNQDPHKTSLQMRLTEEWADATFFTQRPVDTRIQQTAPKGFNCVHPQLSISMVANNNIVTAGEDIRMVNHWAELSDSGEELNTLYEHWVGEKPQATFTLLPESSAHIGTIETSFYKDWRAHYMELSSDSLYFTGVNALPMSKVSMQTILSVNDDRLNDTISGPVYDANNGLWYPSSMSGMMTGTRTYESGNENRKCAVSIPAHWMIKPGETRKITVTLKVTRSVGRYDLNWYSHHMHSDGSTFLTLQSQTTEVNVDMGSLVMQLDFGKLNTAWAASSIHGSHNFLHLIDGNNAAIDHSLLILNSSSALSTLAQSMPRPGNFRDLFTLGNQMLPEALGTFTDDFARTLAAIYPNDTTTLDPVRTPAPTFDFNAAYGGYGWEMFYHIPAALAASYVDCEQYDQALRWFEKIFDPKLETPWQVLPMANASAPDNGLAFDTGDTIIDPDRIATDYPFYYQQAIIRQYLETIIAAGDSTYKEQTQETLQRAKALYVSAKQLFSEQLPKTLNALANQPWTNPSLAEVAADSYTGFLPPYNQEVHAIYNTLNERLGNLRQWLDIEGNPLNIPLLSAPIDPLQLQKTAKARLTLASKDDAEAEEKESLLDFITVARSVKQYITNMKTTASRLQAALEKADGTQMAHALRTNNKNKINRALALQDLGIEVAKKGVDIKIANLAAENSALRNELQKNLRQYRNIAKAIFQDAKDRVGLVRTNTKNNFTYIKTKIQDKFPTIYGMASGGASLVAAGTVGSVNSVVEVMSMTKKGLNYEFRRKLEEDAKETIVEIAELASKIASASLELQKAKKELSAEERKHNDLNQELLEAEGLIELGKAAFGNNEFYNWLKTDLEQLLAEEWSITLEFCRLLATLFDDETGQTNGQSFIKTTSLGGERERFNAPYRLALDIERLEMAYIRSVMDQQSQSTSLTFSLNEVPSLNGQQSALDALVEHGEAYFELTDEMFEVLYPGQYDRNILGVSVHFPGLAKAGLSPHGRLIQIANTRYHTRERDLKRGGKIRKNRHALQSIMLDAPTVDTATFDYPDGLLKRFQNTGVESRWRIVLPTIYELKCQQLPTARSKAWRKSATQHFGALAPHLDDIAFTVTFCGRW